MLIPLRERVLVELEPLEEVTAGGIVLAGQAGRDKWRTGRVKAIGKEVKEIEVGDRVVFSGFAGNEVPSDDTLRIVQEAEVLGVFKNG
jgi:co-chaperonin GroES (HSP10)